MPRIFMSYAHADNDTGLVDRLEERLNPLCKIALPEPVELWRDQRFVLVGQNLEQVIVSALNEADIGLLLLSANFLNSEFIRQHELPRLLALAEKGRLVPVMLRRVPFGGVEMAGLHERLIFQYQNKAWIEMTTRYKQDAFAEALFNEILRLNPLGMTK